MNYVRALKTRILTENFFRPRWYSIFINPYYIGRAGLYRSIRVYARTVPKSSKILDIGCGIKPYRSLFSSAEYTGIDIKGGGHGDDQKMVDTFYDGVHIPFLDTSFNSIICTQVLEHASDPEAVISETARVLSSGGTVFISMPFIYPEHEVPYDFRRFTRYEHIRLLERYGLENIEIQQTTGFFGAFGQLFIVMCFEGMHFRAPILKGLLTLFVFAPIQILSLFLDCVFRKAGPTLDYVVTATKI